MPRKKAKEIVKKVVKKKKAKKKLYFGIEVQDAIVRYNALDPDKDQSERNKIYGGEIHKAFDKLAENIINTFKFTYFDDPFIDVKHEVVAFMVVNIHKYDHTKGSKAFSYFSVIAKNYLILHNNANYKKYKSHYDISALERKKNISSNTEEYDNFLTEIVAYFEEKIPYIFKRKKDLSVAYAIMDLIIRRADIENFNKKALYILIREMTNVETSHITKVTNVLKVHYKKILKEYLIVGYIDIKRNNPFF